jgi:hypothetical protein
MVPLLFLTSGKMRRVPPPLGEFQNGASSTRSEGLSEERRLGDAALSPLIAHAFDVAD